MRWLGYVAVATLGWIVRRTLPLWRSRRGLTPIGRDLLVGSSRRWCLRHPGWRSAIAILKYRLYDIDVVIRKTVVFAVVAVVHRGS